MSTPDRMVARAACDHELYTSAITSAHLPRIIRDNLGHSTNELQEWIRELLPPKSSAGLT